MSESGRTTLGVRQGMVVSAMVLGLLWSWPSPRGWAQADGGFFEVPCDPSLMVGAPADKKFDDRKIKQLQLLKNNVLTGSLAFAENRGNLDLWYGKYVFRVFSHLDQLQKLPERRKEVVDDLRRARSREARDYLLAETMKFMKVYASNTRFNFHPAVRYNALLLIGELNKEEVSTQQRYPNPLPEALTFLIDEYKKPNQSEALRLACMLGILRHAQLNWGRPEADRIPNAQRSDIAVQMLALIGTSTPTGDATPEGHVWMQRRALDVLAALGAMSSDKVNQAVTKVYRDHDADLLLRLTAASTLGHLPLKPPANSTLDPVSEALHLGGLLVEACQQEIKNIDEFLQVGTGAMDPYGMMMGGMSMGGVADGMMMSGAEGGGLPGGMPGDMSGLPGGDMMGGGIGYGGPKDPQLDLFRRRLKYEVVSVEQGLAGIKRLVPKGSPKEAVVQRIDDQVQAIKKATDPPPMALTLPAFQKSIKDSLLRLEALTASVLPKDDAAPPESPASKPKSSDVPTLSTSTGTAKKAKPSGTKPTNPAKRPASPKKK